MRLSMFGLAMLALAAALAATAPAYAAGYLQQIAIDSCEKVNADKLPFTCELRGIGEHIPWMILIYPRTFKLDDNIARRQGALALDFFRAGGKHFFGFNMETKQQWECAWSNDAGQLYCSKPHPIDTSTNLPF